MRCGPYRVDYQRRQKHRDRHPCIYRQPEGANGRNVVAYGMLNALTSKYKTMVFRPAVSNHDEFTPILLAASNAGLGVALSTGLDVHKVREDKDTARGDIVGAFNDAMDVSRADAALIVGTDKSHVNDPTSYEFDANVAADLKAGVFLAVCTIDRWPHELDETVKLSIEAWSRWQQGARHLRDRMRAAPRFLR